ncbi:MAG TPA: bL35 family ribosomal protein [Candidatus Dojkabacteria bacterium]|nr:bL35 family ribosomal protein [Candidatus Dojkabacteria bacterium]
MARQKTNKTAKKRFNVSNPRGNKTPKIMYKQSHQGHLKTKRSSTQKRRLKDNALVSKTIGKKMLRKVVNVNK